MIEIELTKAEVDVISERRRHVTGEGWTSQHDDRYQDLELCYAAAAYAGPIWEDDASRDRGDLPMHWPWDPSWYKPRSPREDLVRAASLILAEIERIDRASGATPSPAPAAPPIAETATPPAAPEPTGDVIVSEHPFLRIFDVPGEMPNKLFMLTRDAETGVKRGDGVLVENPTFTSISAAENYVIAFLDKPPISKGATAYPGEDRPYANEANAIVLNYTANLIHAEGNRGRGNVVLMHRDDLPLLIAKTGTGFKPVDAIHHHGRWTLAGKLGDMEVWVTVEMPPRVYRGQAVVLYAGRDTADRVAIVARHGRDIKVAIQRSGSDRLADDFIRIVDMYPERREPVSLYT